MITVIIALISSIIGAVIAPCVSHYFWNEKILTKKRLRRDEIELTINNLNPECFELLKKIAISGNGVKMRINDNLRVLTAKRLVRIANNCWRMDETTFVYIVDDIACDLVRKRLGRVQSNVYSDK